VVDRLTALRRHWVARVVLVFLASRVVTTAILLCFASNQAKNSWTPAHPGYFGANGYAQLWDAHWYLIVAFGGYPSTLPLTDDGHVGDNAWAFYPVYPWLTRALSMLSGLGGQAAWDAYSVAAVIVSVLAALAAALLTYRLFVEASLAPGQALGGVALFLASPASTVLQVGYAEPLALCFLAWALLELQRRRYWLTILPAVLMAFTRPMGLAFALTLALHLGLRWWRARRDADAFPVRERVAGVVAAGVATLAGAAWVWIAAAATGVPDAYTQTELHWRASYLGYGGLVPFSGWFAGGAWWAEWIHWPGWVGVVGAVVIVLAYGAFLFTPWARRLGETVRLWSGAFFVYLLAVFFPQSSTWRMLLPVHPLLGAFALRRWTLWVTLAAFLVGQWFWVDQEWAVAGYDWTPP